MIIRPGRSNQSGIALVSVLIGISILGLIAISMLAASRLTTRTTRQATDDLQIRALLDAATSRAVLALFDQRPSERWRVDGISQSTQLFGHTVRISIQDEYGKIDLNAAGADLLLRLLITEGVSALDAQPLVDKILDWRETGAGRRLNGAKAKDYRDAGFSYGPRNENFQSVDELGLVMGMTPELLDRLRPALTVYTGKASIDLETAPRQALLTSPGIDNGNVDAFISGRAALGAEQVGPIVGGVIQQGIPLEGWPLTVTVAILRGDGEAIERKTILRLTSDARRPYWILSEHTQALGETVHSNSVH